ncbi:class I SAM-dependent methyltransferase [Deinococcus radiophilus]|uniref:Class I SAM-dependent methyltransferase n=1 Tax=Deinococcus radiophilus TaxID=32062 RepID=A0A3S0L560_9DEIO|nr:class I SAM-dependent methyltransferase [Deinococcus radiophilus]RTR27277.1 class I SAM-dependent methyltransferase [Deinococcus radiophilus]UFA50639.1 class I SAM-dependent methyltransferase [Deinococcus radiophilus]
MPRLTLAQRSNFLPLTAWGYSLWRERSLTLLGGQPFPLWREARLFLGHCRPQPGEYWLDVGTSAGFYAGVLAGAGCRVTATDLSPAMLRSAQRRVQGPQIEWAQINSETLPAPWHGAFDGVTIGATLNETADPAALLRSAVLALRPGGQLWLMYLQNTGGSMQRRLVHPAFGGLTFPAPAWIGAQLPGMSLEMGVTFGAVRFEQWVRLTYT